MIKLVVDASVTMNARYTSETADTPNAYSSIKNNKWSLPLTFSNAGIKTNAITEREHPVLIDITMGGNV